MMELSHYYHHPSPVLILFLLLLIFPFQCLQGPKITAYLRANQGKARANNIGWLNTYRLQYKKDPSQDLTANPSRVNNSGSGLSSPSLLQPCTKPFSGRPARPQMTCPIREAGKAIRERPGVVCPLLPRAQRPDTRVVIEAALPEAAALDRRAQPLTVVEIGDTSLPQQASSSRRRASRRQSCKTHRNRLTGVYRTPKRSPPHGRWCE